MVNSFVVADYRRLHVWERAAKLAVTTYSCANTVSDAGHGSLADQMKRAAGSIGANIAEGSGHRSRKEFRRFLTYAIASSSELENHVMLAADVKALSRSDSAVLVEEIAGVRRMLTALRAKTENR